MSLQNKYFKDGETMIGVFSEVWVKHKWCSYFWYLLRSCRAFLWKFLVSSSAPHGLTHPALLGAGHFPRAAHPWPWSSHLCYPPDLLLSKYLWLRNGLWCGARLTPDADNAVKKPKQNKNNQPTPPPPPRSLILWFEAYLKGLKDSG